MGILLQQYYFQFYNKILILKTKQMGYERNPNFTPITLSIQKSNKNDHQLIYASQLYGTFFAVSGKLNINETNGIKHLIGIELTLTNYKGLFNIGILPQTKELEINTTGNATLVLHLSALRGNHGSSNRVTVTCEPFKIDDLKDINVSRELHAFADYQNGNLTDHLKDDEFDSEFYERDGSAIYRKQRMDIVSQGQPTNIVGPRVSPTGQCKDTFSKFI